jgi:hypothetical protein
MQPQVDLRTELGYDVDTAIRTGSNSMDKWAIPQLLLAAFLSFVMAMQVGEANAKPCGRGHIAASKTCHK